MKKNYRHILTILFLIAFLESCSSPGYRKYATSNEYDFIDQDTLNGLVDNADKNELSFLTSNESNYYEFIKFFHEHSIGGGYVGIGAEQNYDMMAFSKSKFAWLVDRNPTVSTIHLIYRAAFIEAENADQFLEIISSDQKVNSLIAKYYANSKVEPFIKNFLTEAHKKNEYKDIVSKLQNLSTSSDETFLNRAENYTYIRNMYLENKVKILSGTNNDPGLFKKIITEATSINIPINNVYLSNSHQLAYIESNMDGFQANLEMLGKYSNPFILTSRTPESSVVSTKIRAVDLNKFNFHSIEVGKEFSAGFMNWQFHALKSNDYFLQFKSNRPTVIGSCINFFKDFIY